MKFIACISITSVVVILLTLPNSTSSVSEPFPILPQFTIADNVELQQKIIPMHIPIDNKLPWAFVEGKVINSAPGYPVIIQIYKNGEPIHFAQTDVKEDGSYEYKFRARNIDGDQVINIFQGDYTVKIFKTVNISPSAKIV